MIVKRPLFKTKCIARLKPTSLKTINGWFNDRNLDLTLISIIMLVGSTNSFMDHWILELICFHFFFGISNLFDSKLLSKACEMGIPI